MPSNTQNSTEVPSSTAVADKRERRRQKILQNSEDRMSKILTAHSDGEKRLAPAIEGMSDAQQTLISDDSLARTRKLLAISGAEVPDDGGTFQQRLNSYCNYFDRHRLHISLSFGVLLRLLAQFGLVRFVARAFLVAFIVCQIFLRFRHFVKPNATDSLLTNFLLICGLNEHFVRLNALIFDTLWKFVTNFCAMTFAFLVTHCLFIVSKCLQSIIGSFL